MKTSDFEFELPEALIASTPASSRTASRLFCLDKTKGALSHQHFKDLIDWVRPGDLMVFNNTKVLPARLHGQKASGGRVECLLERLQSERTALMQIRASKSCKPGEVLYFKNGMTLVVQGKRDFFYLVEIGNANITIPQMLDRIGEVPIPPYMMREANAMDLERYQTVYADVPGSVAAPTAGLHFDESLFALLAAKGVHQAFVTLHIGAGTFAPIRVQDVREHRMHLESYSISQSVIDHILATKQAHGRVIAVGTTSVRVLETVFGGKSPYQGGIGETGIFIYPPYRFRVVDALITNFHLPASTLLMLVAAFAGHSLTMAAYLEAVREKYRFYSYGDAMFIY